MLSNHLILYRPVLLLSNFPSIRVFSNESVLPIRWPKYWSFNFNISPSNEYSGLISFRIDWFDLLAVQGTLKSCFQHHSSKASILQCSAFLMIQISHPLSHWCHSAISSSVTLFSSYLQSFPISRSFPMSQLFTSGGQSIGASVSFIPVNNQGLFPLGLTHLISLLS